MRDGRKKKEKTRKDEAKRYWLKIIKRGGHSILIRAKKANLEKVNLEK